MISKVFFRILVLLRGGETAALTARTNLFKQLNLKHAAGKGREKAIKVLCQSNSYDAH